MPQAKITIGGVPGSNLDWAINTLVQLGNQGNGGESTYKWTIISQPPGPADALNNDSISNPTFTPKKEGSYLLKLEVNKNIAGESTDTQEVGIKQVDSLHRIPAPGETTQASATGGWAEPELNEFLRELDHAWADPGVMTGRAGEALTRGNIVRCAEVTKILVGLPGERFLPTWTKAPASTLGNLDEPLGVVESRIDGNDTAANGAYIRVRRLGIIGPITGATGASAGDPVYVSDTAVFADAPGTNRRQVGSYASIDGANNRFWVLFDAGSGLLANASAAFLLNSADPSLANAIVISALTAALGLLRTNGATNAIADILQATSGPAGAGAAGIGAALLFRAKGAAALQDVARIAAILTNAGAGTEASDLVLQIRAAGGALAEAARLTSNAELIPAADASGSVGTNAKRWNLIRGVTITSGDLVFEDEACPKCGAGFAPSQELSLVVVRIEYEDRDGARRPLTRTVPAHRSCP